MNCIHDPARFLRLLPVIGLLLGSVADLSAGSAQWNTGAQTSDWNTSQNWTPNAVPNGSSDVATFGFSQTATVTFSAATEVSDIVFDPSASAYSLLLGGETLMTLSGRGVVNNSAVTQTILAGHTSVGTLATILFANTASAGTNTVLVTHGGLNIGDDGGFILFRDNSTADHADITNNSEGPGFAGITQFQGNASAGNATFHDNGAAIGGTGSGGSTAFGDFATADNATFTTSGGSAAYAVGGETIFFGQSTAASATFTVRGSTGMNSSGGTVAFRQYATAAHATFNIEGGAVSNTQAGRVTFSEQATVGDAVFIVSGGSVSGGAGGQINFSNASAENGQFTLNGGVPGAQGTWVYFQGGSLSNAVFTVNGGTQNGSSGALLQLGGVTADAALVTTNGGTTAGAAGGMTQVSGNANLGNATFTINGSMTAGAPGGTIHVYDSANLGNATVIVAAGSNGGEPGFLSFAQAASGGAAHLILDLGTTADMSDHTQGYPLSLGVLTGAGTVVLGNSEFTLGTSNADNTFPGLITDGTSGFRHGSLRKQGTGTLILTNANTYSGTTTVDAGTLAVNGSGTDTAMVVDGGIFILNGTSTSTVATINGGVLMVNGSVPAAVTVNSSGTLAGIGRVGTITVSKGGSVSPGNNSPGTLTAVGDMVMTKKSNLSLVIDGTAAGQVAVGGQVNLGSAVLSVSLGMVPSNNAQFTIVSNNGSSPVLGTFNKLKENGKLKVGKHLFRISYKAGDGNDVVLTKVR